MRNSTLLKRYLVQAVEDLRERVRRRCGRPHWTMLASVLQTYLCTRRPDRYVYCRLCGTRITVLRTEGTVVLSAVLRHFREQHPEVIHHLEAALRQGEEQ